DHEHVLRLVDARDVDLPPVENPPVLVPTGSGGDVVGVGAGIGLGDGERHGAGAVADARQPAPLLLLGPEPADDGSADRRTDDPEEKRTPLGGQLLAARRDVADPAATAAVLLRDVDTEIPVAPDLEPELGRLLTAARLLGEPLAAVLRGQS